MVLQQGGHGKRPSSDVIQGTHKNPEFSRTPDHVQCQGTWMKRAEIKQKRC
jgi:hypothetical protein